MVALLRSGWDIGLRLVRRAGWAPVSVVLLHLLLSQGLKLYRQFPHLDIPMHALGGIAMAYFLSRSFAAIPVAAIPPGGSREAIEALAVFTTTATGAVFWEFAEFICDHAFHSRAQGGNSDTMGDLAVGISGCLLYLLVAWRRGRLGRIEPIVATESRS